MKLSDRHCPCCQNQLSFDGDEAGRYAAWCGNGRCLSEMGDRGALGDTPEEAADSLIKSMMESPDWD